MNEPKNILETILDRMVNVTQKLEVKLTEKSEFVQSLQVPGWNVELITENQFFVVAKIKALKNSRMSLRKNGYSNICVFKLLNESCNILITECKEHCLESRKLCECMRQRNNFITLRLNDHAEEDKSVVGKNHMIHITPNHCYDIEVLEDSTFLFCMLSSAI